MYKNIDELININLDLLFNSTGHSLMRFEFRDENNKDLVDSKRFAELLDDKGLIKLEPIKGWRCDLTEFGHNICMNEGGWIKHLEFKNLKNQKSLNENPMTLYQKIYLTGFIIFGVLTILLEVRNNSLKTDYDSLKSQSDLYKDSIAELKGQIELYRLKISNDTLQTKSLNDLKTD